MWSAPGSTAAIRWLSTPGLTLSEKEVETIVDYTTRIGRALQVKGLMNIQYVVVGGPAYRSPSAGNGGASLGQTQVFVLEVNPRPAAPSLLYPK